MQSLFRGDLSIVSEHLVDYPTTRSLTYLWNFGFLAGLFLVVQLVSGIVLAMHYVPDIRYAFDSVEHIMRDVNYGWLLRYIHANGASMFFIIIYTHIGKGLYYGSYNAPRESLWVSGMVIFILMMGTGFIGYVLPWGQMSFWGATVITNLVSAIPVIGVDIVYWIWGGFSVNNATLSRFFSLHYLLPFVLAAMAIVHLYFLHKSGSSTPLGISIKHSAFNQIPFFPYYYIKDLFGFLVFLIFFGTFVFFYPNALGHPDNYIEANPMVTPAHIVPEWYFLPFYAILRSIPHKLGGVIFMGGALIVVLLLPFIIKLSNSYNAIYSSRFKLIFKKFYWLFLADFFLLGWLGQCPVEEPYILVGQILTAFYFVYFLILIPFVGNIDYYLYKKA